MRRLSKRWLYCLVLISALQRKAPHDALPLTMVLPLSPPTVAAASRVHFWATSWPMPGILATSR